MPISKLKGTESCMFFRQCTFQRFEVLEEQRLGGHSGIRREWLHRRHSSRGMISVFIIEYHLIIHLAFSYHLKIIRSVLKRPDTVFSSIRNSARLVSVGR